MKTRSKILLTLSLSALLFALLVPLFAFGASAEEAADPANYVADLHNLLSDSEKQQIADAMQSAQQKTECNFVFLYYSYQKPYQEGVCRKKGYSYLSDYEVAHASPLIDLPPNVMVLEVTEMGDSYDPYTFKVHIFGENGRTSQSELEYLEDKIESAIKSGRFAEGAGDFVRYGEKAFYGKFANWGRIFFIAAMIALGFTAVAGIVIYGKYKKKVHSAVYPLDQFAKMQLTERSDVCVGRSVSRVPISSGSSGHGGGGGSGRSGGGGHSSGSRR